MKNIITSVHVEERPAPRSFSDVDSAHSATIERDIEREESRWTSLTEAQREAESAAAEAREAKEAKLAETRARLALLQHPSSTPKDQQVVPVFDGVAAEHFSANEITIWAMKGVDLEATTKPYVALGLPSEMVKTVVLTAAQQVADKIVKTVSESRRGSAGAPPPLANAATAAEAARERMGSRVAALMDRKLGEATSTPLHTRRF